MRLVGLLASLLFLSSTAHASDRTEEQKELQNVWYHCIRVYALTVAEETDEPASIIAKAAMTACEDEENNLFQHFNSGQEPVRSFAVEEIFPAIKRHNHEKILSEILAKRASK